MFRLIGLVVSIGMADSLNPSTIAPALYIASGDRPRLRLAQFIGAVFAVYFIGGAVVALGPGQLLLSLVPKPAPRTRNVIEIAAGAAMLVASLLLWRHRSRLSERSIPAGNRKGRSSAILGATIIAVELPTAFPYFAAIAAIVGSGENVTAQVLLLVLFNVCFVAPLLGILLTVWLAGDHADRWLNPGRAFLQRHWPVLLSGLALIAGILVVLLGVTGLAQHHHGRLGRLMKGFHHLLAP